MKNVYDASGMQPVTLPAGAEATGSVTTAYGASDHATGNISVGYRLSKENVRMKNALQALAVFAFLALAVGGDIATSLL